MGKTRAGSPVEAPASFTDVIYLSDKPDLPLEVRRLFRQKKVSFRLLPLDGYRLVHLRPDLVGTVIIDAEGIDTSQDQRLGRILESLERDNLGIILLTQRIQRPVRSFSLMPSDSSFSMTDKVTSVSLDALWARISVNLADRTKQDSGIAVKPPSAFSAAQRFGTSKPAESDGESEPRSDNLTEQLRLAGLVQRDFLPANLPNSDAAQWAVTFIPAEWVSGDIYDIARIDEQHIGFYIADAVGHSMPAALLTIFIKQAMVMRETIDKSYRIFAPTEVITNLNLKMLGQKLSGYQFATCCYGLLNIKTRQMVFARAGHPYPILFREGQEPLQLETRGSLLGVFENAEFTQGSVQLQSGDRLLLYSDGAESLVGQLINGEGFRFTDELLALRDAPIRQIVDTLTELQSLREIAPEEVDDFTLVGLEIP
jgi:sigma-B regulation protein RsbU (phosphoserine phosphatase)